MSVRKISDSPNFTLAFDALRFWALEQGLKANGDLKSTIEKLAVNPQMPGQHPAIDPDYVYEKQRDSRSLVRQIDQAFQELCRALTVKRGIDGYGEHLRAQYRHRLGDDETYYFGLADKRFERIKTKRGEEAGFHRAIDKTHEEQEASARAIARRELAEILGHGAAGVGRTRGTKLRGSGTGADPLDERLVALLHEALPTNESLAGLMRRPGALALLFAAYHGIASSHQQGSVQAVAQDQQQAASRLSIELGRVAGLSGLGSGRKA